MSSNYIIVCIYRITDYFAQDTMGSDTNHDEFEVSLSYILEILSRVLFSPLKGTWIVLKTFFSAIGCIVQTTYRYPKVALFISFWLLVYLCIETSREKKKEALRQTNNRYRNESQIRYSNPHNNHDDQKYKHTTRESAKQEVHRMISCGYEGSHKLKVYFNRENEGWYVGKSAY